MPYVMKFNGVNSKIDCGDPDPLTGDISVGAMIKPYSRGEASAGKIFDNGKLIIEINANIPIIGVTSNGAAYNYSSTDITYGKQHLVIVVRKADGKFTIYINGIQSGAADQASGIPEAGSTNLIIGNNNAGSRTWDGLINDNFIIKGLLTSQQASQIWTNIKGKYNL